ncbi:MAG: non-homologous end-joining DNA ligase [Coriobacteriales bacterium]|nr:non-homologous end-joining DNA ligase [Actinomycetes bacterium]
MAGIYVVQKHAATRLHYDFRLELDGALKSWAVPKGPSMDPAQKRLAVPVEDHPIDYATFEGVIPSGEYGAGTVMVWDRGTWDPVTDPHEGYAKGSMKIRLNGERLHGGFALVRLKPRPGEDQPGWLLIKEKDEYARPLAAGDVLDQDTSVLTGRTMDEIASAAADQDPQEAPEAVEVAGVRLTHPDRVLFAEMGATKLDLARYYEAVGERMLPYVADRPLVLVRCPEGTGGECFYQKDVSQGFPDRIATVEVRHEEGPVHYALVEDVGDLVTLVQLGVLEIHTWGALARDVEKPDRVVIDLDPGPGVVWEAVTRAALAVRDELVALGLVPFVKTTGGKGLHVVAPIVPEGDWDTVKAFARKLCEKIVSAEPDRYTTNPLKTRREKKVFIDYLRNARGATAVAPYSTRARAGATVAMPVTWEAVISGVTPDAYTLKNVPTAVADSADPWANHAGSARPITADALRALGVV